MTINKKITAINNILENNKIGKAIIADATSELFKGTEADLLEEIKKYEQGWICLTSALVPITNKEDFSEINGKILSGELVKKNKSFHIRRNGDKLIAYTIEKIEGGDSSLMIEESFINKEKELGKLKYETFWKEENGALQPYISRFAGFEKGE